MKRPSDLALLLGQPLVGGGLILGGGGIAYVGWETSNAILMVGAMVAIGKVATALDEAGKYRAWKRAWDAMDEDAPKRAALRRGQLTGIAFGLALIAGYLAGYGPLMLHYAVLAPIGLVALLAIHLIARTISWRHRRRARRAAKPYPVAIVATTVLRVPTLAEAYKALPAHCDAILGPRP